MPHLNNHRDRNLKGKLLKEESTRLFRAQITPDPNGPTIKIIFNFNFDNN